jgi:SAM-dependent methyltransferase
VLDLASRRLKALKIERLLHLEQLPGPLRMLEIGTGSGGIAHYFGCDPSGKYAVHAVDVVDNRQVWEGYEFSAVQGTQLPFADSAFDVVISNHVIEHVGDEAAQRRHLDEIARVLCAGGVGYLAVPNRWMLIEPHYRLPFLSWLPRSWRSPYLRAFGRGQFYDCEPLQMRQLEALLSGSGLAGRNLGVEALRATFEIERPGSLGTRMLPYLPDALLHAFDRVIPTLIYRFEAAAASTVPRR